MADMVFKIVLVVAQALLLKSIAAQAIGCGAGPLSYTSTALGYASPALGCASSALGYASPALGYASPALGYASPALGCASPAFGYATPACGCESPAFGYAAPAAALAASNGPGLVVSSSSPLAPIGISVTSENIIEGALAVAGALPFLGTVGLEGVLPTTGAGDVAYNCGNGAVAITAEDIADAPLEYATAGPIGYPAIGEIVTSPFAYYGPSVAEVVSPFGCASSPLAYGPSTVTEVISPLGFASPLSCAASPLSYASPASYITEPIFAASPISYTAGTLGYGSGPISYSAGVQRGFGAGPFRGYGYI